MKLALETDSTRVISLFIDTTVIHPMTHHGNRPEVVAELRGHEERQFDALNGFLTALARPPRVPKPSSTGPRSCTGRAWGAPKPQQRQPPGPPRRRRLPPRPAPRVRHEAAITRSRISTSRCSSGSGSKPAPSRPGDPPCGGWRWPDLDPLAISRRASRSRRPQGRHGCPIESPGRPPDRRAMKMADGRRGASSTSVICHRPPNCPGPPLAGPGLPPGLGLASRYSSDYSMSPERRPFDGYARSRRDCCRHLARPRGITRMMNSVLKQCIGFIRDPVGGDDRPSRSPRAPAVEASGRLRRCKRRRRPRRSRRPRRCMPISTTSLTRCWPSVRNASRPSRRKNRPSPGETRFGDASLSWWAASRRRPAPSTRSRSIPSRKTASPSRTSRTRAARTTGSPPMSMCPTARVRFRR